MNKRVKALPDGAFALLYLTQQYKICFAALMAATKFHFDGPKALPLEFARTLAGPGPRFADVHPRKQSSADDTLRPRA